MKSLILYFFRLVLGILLNSNLNVGYKLGKFFGILSKKSFEFISNMRGSMVTFNLSYILLLVKVDLDLEE